MSIYSDLFLQVAKRSKEKEACILPVVSKLPLEARSMWRQLSSSPEERFIWAEIHTKAIASGVDERVALDLMTKKACLHHPSILRTFCTLLHPEEARMMLREQPAGRFMLSDKGEGPCKALFAICRFSHLDDQFNGLYYQRGDTTCKWWWTFGGKVGHDPKSNEPLADHVRAEEERIGSLRGKARQSA